MDTCVMCYFEGITPPRTALYKVGRKGRYCAQHKGEGPSTQYRPTICHLS